MKELIIKCYEESDGIVPIYQFPKDGMNIPIVGELIRCKDCKWYEQWTNHKICMLLGSYYGDTKPNDYCSNAERRESQ